MELGLKLDISACDRFPCMEKQSFETYNVSMALKAFIKRYRWRIRECPERVIETRFIGIVIILSSSRSERFGHLDSEKTCFIL